MAKRDKYKNFECPFNKAINVFITTGGNVSPEPCGMNPENCKKCGWNPLEKYRRDTYGEWEYDEEKDVKYLYIGAIKRE